MACAGEFLEKLLSGTQGGGWLGVLGPGRLVEGWLGDAAHKGGVEGGVHVGVHE